MDTETHAHRALARLADAQHGVVARRQLLAIGMTPTMVVDRMKDRRLVALHRGVYALGHRHLRREGWWLAAVLAAGEGAVLSHRDAAALHGLRSANGRAADVTTTRQRASVETIRIHRVRALDPLDSVVVDGIPVTTVARTLVDLAGVVPRDHLARALTEAERLGLLDVDAVEAARQRVRNRHGQGHAALGRALADHAQHGATLTRSELEARFLALLAAHGLPRPHANATLHGYEVDALWPEARVVVELDGYAFHHARTAFQRDRSKANALTLQGYVVLRYTHDDVARRPRRVATELRGLLTT